MKNSTKSDIGVLKEKALEKFTRQFELAVKQGRMTEDRKDQILNSIGDIADGFQLEAREHNVEVQLAVEPVIPGSHDFTVDMCVYNISSVSKDAETMDVHHAMCLATITNATKCQI